MSSDPQLRNHAAFIWSVADKLRGVYKQSEYGRVILPLVVLRRLDCVLEPTKAAVLARHAALKGQGRERRAGPPSRSRASSSTTRARSTSVASSTTRRTSPGNLRSYIAGLLAGGARRDREVRLRRPDHAARRARTCSTSSSSQFAEIDLHPNVVSNLEMGYLYEELVRRFSELSNETAGEHFTPREVIRLMVNLLFVEDDELLRKRGIVRTLFDPACGTGGMLSVAEDYLRDLNPDARLEVFGQELNDETYAVCRSDMMLKGQDASHIVSGQLVREDGHEGRTFDYMLANPPFGVEWKSVEQTVKDERETLGFRGRFGAGLPGDQRRQLPLPPAHDLEDEAGRGGRRLADRDRLQRLAALHRRSGLGAIRDPPLDHRERLARGRRRPARPALLQHRHLDLLLGRHEPQEP